MPRYVGAPSLVPLMLVPLSIHMIRRGGDQNLHEALRTRQHTVVIESQSMGKFPMLPNETTNDTLPEFRQEAFLEFHWGRDNQISRQLNKEVAYLVHSDFYINAFVTRNGHYDCFPDCVLLTLHAADMVPRIILDWNSLSIEYPMSTPVMLEGRIHGTLSGRVLCQVVGPKAGRYTTCESNLEVSLQPHHNSKFEMFTGETFTAATSQSVQGDTCKAEQNKNVFEKAEIVTGRVLRKQTFHKSKVTMSVQQLQRTCLYRNKECNADFYLIVEKPRKKGSKSSETAFYIGPEVARRRLVSITLDERLCLKIDVANANRTGTKYTLCPPAVQLSNASRAHYHHHPHGSVGSDAVPLDEGFMNQYLNKFPNGRDLLNQLCSVGTPSVLPEPQLNFNFCKYMKLRIMGLRKEMKRIEIKWESKIPNILDHRYFAGANRKFHMKFRDTRDKQKIKNEDFEGLEDQVLSNIEELLSGFEIPDGNRDRKSQLLKDATKKNLPWPYTKH